MKTTRIAAWLLSVLTVASVMTACGGDPADNGTVTENAGKNNDAVTEAVDTAELTELQKRQMIPDNLPEHDWGGKDFRIICSEEFDVDEEFWVEEQNGDQCNDAVYARNEKIESRFNVKLSILPQCTVRDDTPKFFNNMVMAGDDAAEICAYYSDGKDGDKIPVDYCKRKFVKKPNKSKAGFVTYTDYKTILVKPDPHR
jgi:hypothetical protein